MALRCAGQIDTGKSSTMLARRPKRLAFEEDSFDAIIGVSPVRRRSRDLGSAIKGFLGSEVVKDAAGGIALGCPNVFGCHSHSSPGGNGSFGLTPYLCCRARPQGQPPKVINVSMDCRNRASRLPLRARVQTGHRCSQKSGSNICRSCVSSVIFAHREQENEHGMKLSGLPYLY